MRWLYKLERKYGKYHINNGIIYVVLTMLCIYIMDYVIGVGISPLLTLSRAALLRGQVWRLITFIFIPPASSILFVAITLYFYYFIGSTLEDAWGGFKFDVYYLCGILGAIAAALISGYGDNTYLNLSMFLAFAHLFPDQQVLLFFIIPVKMRWLGWITWGIYAINLLLGSWATKAALLCSLINFFIFFGPTLFKHFKDRQKFSAVRRNFRNQTNKNNHFYR